VPDRDPPNPIFDALDEITHALEPGAPTKDKVNRLIASLEAAEELDRRFLLRDECGPSGLRLTTVVALRSLVKFLQSVGQQSFILTRLLAGLYELDAGHIPVLMKPSSADPGRKGDSYRVVSYKSAAAAAMHLLMNEGTGESKDRAAAIVARQLKNTRFCRHGGKPISASMVAGWRDRCINRHDPKDAFLAHLFEWQIAVARGAQSSPAKQAHHLMANLRDRADRDIAKSE
jgi:hypothetical protein